MASVFMFSNIFMNSLIIRSNAHVASTLHFVLY